MYERVIQKSTCKNINKFSSQKCNRIMRVESCLEYDACFHFEFASQITAFKEQPLGFKYELNGKSHSYTPDFIVRIRTGEEIFYEVKPYGLTISDEFRLKFQAMQAASLTLGKKLELITDKQIRQAPLLNNLKLLHRYQRIHNYLSQFQKQLLKLITAAEKFKLSDLIEKTNTSFSEIIPSIADLLAKDILQSNLLKPLALDSELVYNGQLI
ncbi:TnsA endonuclease N-terminal domain-containing protein [Catenovulum maritimum]|uniref:TnsA endonuclease N-terminal domain-containing protein n=1 Tax=Catenovulum maritimum TaxID=1513271 RepID=A0A0J8H1X1_9ALTE|nr:TnsA endonuclease N-terminal domain-containing protein [Catenovulum maritimum]KMT67003.1 hypothetical protein XM47_01280 [Catenovulum maritimum]